MNKPTEKDYAAAQAIAQYSLDPMAKYWNGKTAQIIADRVAEALAEQQEKHIQNSAPLIDALEVISKTDTGRSGLIAMQAFCPSLAPNK